MSQTSEQHTDSHHPTATRGDQHGNDRRQRNVALDGVVQDPAGDEGFRHGGWVGLISNSPQLGKLALDEALSQEAFLLGRRTYDWLAARWPSRSGELADRLNSHTRELTCKGIGLDTADELRFPLGPHHLMVLRPRFPEHRSYYVDARRVADVNRRLAAGCYEMVIACTADCEELAQLRLRAVRPALRFNTAPLLEADASGRMVPTGQEVLHTFIPYGDDAG